MFLYGQLQEDLSYSLIELPLVSSSQNYWELSIAAKNKDSDRVEACWIEKAAIFKDQETTIWRLD